MATVDDVILKIRTRMSDVLDEAYDDAMLIDFINDGQDIYCITSGVFQVIASFTMGGSNDYVEFTYANCGNVNFVHCLAIKHDGIGLAKADLNEAKDWNAVAGVPLGWHLFGNSSSDKRAYFDAIPANTTTITAFIAGKPNDYTVITDTILLDDIGISALAAYGEYRCRAHDKEQSMGSLAYAEFSQIRDSVSILTADNVEDTD